MSDLEFPIVSNATALGPRGSHFPPTSDCYLLKIGPQVLRQILAGAEQGHEVTFKIPEDGARVTTLNVGASEYRLQHNKTDPHYVYDETRQCSQCSTLIAAGAADCAACGADDSALQAIWQHSGLVHGMFTSKSDADGVASQVKQKRAAAKSAKAGDSTSTAVGAGAANSPVPAADSPRLAASVSGTVIPPPLAASSSATRLPSLPSTLRREAGGKLKGLNPSQLGNVAADGGIGAKDSGIAAGAEGESGGGEAGSNSSSSSSSAAAAAAAAAPARAPPKSKTTSKVGSLLQQITGGKPAAAKKGARAKAAGAGSGGVAAHGTHPTSAAAHAAAAAAQMTDGGGAGDVDSGGEGDGEEGATSSGEGGDVDAGAGAAASGAGAGSAPSLIGKKRGRPTGSTAASREGAASAKRMLDAAEASLRPTAIIEARLKDLPDRPRFGLPLSSTTSPAAMEHACAPVRNVKQCMRMSGWVRKHTLQYEALRKWTEKVSASFTEIEAVVNNPAASEAVRGEAERRVRVMFSDRRRMLGEVRRKAKALFLDILAAHRGISAYLKGVAEGHAPADEDVDGDDKDPSDVDDDVAVAAAESKSAGGSLALLASPPPSAPARASAGASSSSSSSSFSSTSSSSSSSSSSSAAAAAAAMDDAPGPLPAAPSVAGLPTADSMPTASVVAPRASRGGRGGRRVVDTDSDDSTSSGDDV